MKLYNNDDSNIYTGLVKVTARILNIQYTEVNVSDSDKELQAKSQTGKFPILETNHGHTIFESISIAKYFARQERGFYGHNDYETSLIDQWVDYVNSSVAPLAHLLALQVYGFQDSDPKTFGTGVTNLKKQLEIFEKQLKLRNFLVGYSLTLADVVLVVHMIIPLQTFLDQAYRKDTIPNLSRYCTLILKNKSFLDTFGRVHFCKKIIQPCYSVKAVPAGDKKPQQEQQQQKQQPKNEQQAKAKAQPSNQNKETKPLQPTASSTQDSAATTEQKPNWEQLLPELKFSFYDYKTLFVNHSSKAEALKTLWDQWDPQALSVWYVNYEKYEGEGVQLPATNNLLGGFMQRMDEKLRKHCLGVLGVYGDEPNLDIKGVFIWRGTDIPEPLLEHPQFEYYQKKKLDPANNEEERKLVEEYFTAKEEESVRGQTVQTKKLYK